MSVNFVHPRFTYFQDDWAQCRDCYRGERVIKDAGSKYLRPTSAMCLDGYPSTSSKGWYDYEGYKHRAAFYNYTKEAVSNYLGMLWYREGSVELPKRMEFLRDKATREGESIMQLWRNMHEEALITGRGGVMADMYPGLTLEEPNTYLTMYKAENIRNWDEGEKDQVVRDSLNLVVLDESTPKRNSDFGWEELRQYRVLLLGDTEVNEASNGKAIYYNGLFKEEDAFDHNAMIAPNYRGNTWKKIPFVFFNSKDIVADPDEPPMLNLSNKDLTIYRLDADYRQTLFLQGQHTLVIIGEGSTEEGGPEKEKPVRTGAGAVIRLANPQSDAKYIGITNAGLSEMRQALEDDKRTAEVLSGSLTDPRSNEKESGVAMQTRVAGQTASLLSIAHTVAEALQRGLRFIAEIMGENPEDVKVTPNTEFSAAKLAPKDLLDLQSAKNSGLPITEESVHQNIKRAGLTDKSYEDEKAQLDEEEPRIDMTGALNGAPMNAKDQAEMDAAAEQTKHSQKMDQENLKLSKETAKQKAKAPV
jgi:hypothetical protein